MGWIIEKPHCVIRNTSGEKILVLRIRLKCRTVAEGTNTASYWRWIGSFLPVFLQIPSIRGPHWRVVFPFCPALQPDVRAAEQSRGARAGPAPRAAAAAPHARRRRGQARASLRQVPATGATGTSPGAALAIHPPADSWQHYFCAAHDPSVPAGAGPPGAGWEGQHLNPIGWRQASACHQYCDRVAFWVKWQDQELYGKCFCEICWHFRR